MSYRIRIPLVSALQLRVAPGAVIEGVEVTEAQVPEVILSGESPSDAEATEVRILGTFQAGKVFKSSEALVEAFRAAIEAPENYTLTPEEIVRGWIIQDGSSIERAKFRTTDPIDGDWLLLEKTSAGS
jgi:hypothetical protein